MSNFYIEKVERQKKEISTIKKRTVTLNLSDADCERISNLAGKSGLSVGELLENFIGDLINGTYSNGSDERYRADQWFERCWFSHRFDGEEDKALLSFMLNRNFNIEYFLSAVDQKDYFFEHESEYTEDVQSLWFVDKIEEVTMPYLEKNPGADLDSEIELCRKWLKELEELKSENLK